MPTEARQNLIFRFASANVGNLADQVPYMITVVVGAPTGLQKSSKNCDIFIGFEALGIMEIFMES
jgi:hypothetical protein